MKERERKIKEGKKKGTKGHEKDELKRSTRTSMAVQNLCYVSRKR